MQEIDWHEEWARHAFQFADGVANIDFQKLGIKREPQWRANAIKLSPGSGFGDCSHATTRLCLMMMSNLVADKVVLDIGSGSGILTLSAIAFGAQQAFGVEIEPDAILHAQENARLNGYEDRCTFALHTHITPDVIVMNMIRTEQKQALESLPPAARQAKIAITSGILKEDRKKYLAQTAEWGWKLVSQKQQGGWLGFHFLIA